jgi:hypothetical protein
LVQMRQNHRRFPSGLSAFAPTRPASSTLNTCFLIAGLGIHREKAAALP